MTILQGRICPYLGLLYDPATHMGFPSDENLCFKWKKPNSPGNSRQQNTCLSLAYLNCPAYRGLGIEPDTDDAGFKGLSSSPVRVAVIVTGILVTAGLIIGWWLSGRNEPSILQPSIPQSSGSLLESPYPSTVLITHPATAGINTIPISVLTSSATITRVLTSESTSFIPSTGLETPSPYPFSYEVTRSPVGSDQNYLVHIIQNGETLDMIASNYHTTVQAILAVNYELKPPIWVQSALVIPIGIEDATGLPSFEVYVVEAVDTITADALALDLGVDAGDLAIYNSCSAGCQYHKGDVLLIPR